MLVFSLRTLALKRGRLMDPRRVAELQRAPPEVAGPTGGRGVGFYREKYRGIDPDRFRLADLPPTNKGELMANFDRTVTDPAVTRADADPVHGRPRERRAALPGPLRRQPHLGQPGPADADGPGPSVRGALLRPPDDAGQQRARQPRATRSAASSDRGGWRS